MVCSQRACTSLAHAILGLQEQDPDFDPSLITFAGVEYHYNKQVWVEERHQWVEQPVRGFGPVTLMFEQGQVYSLI